MSFEFEMHRRFDASPDEVFEALTDPAGQREWWTEGASEVHAEGDLRVGGRAVVEWTADEGHTCRAEQVYVEIVRPTRLVYTEVVTETDVPPYECTLTFTLTAEDGKTLLVLHHTGFPNSSERDKHERGTSIFFERLGRFVAARSAPRS